jgi:hypothetical protein
MLSRPIRPEVQYTASEHTGSILGQVEGYQKGSDCVLWQMIYDDISLEADVSAACKGSHKRLEY